MSEASAGAGAADAYFESFDGGAPCDRRPESVFGPLDAIYCISLQEQQDRRDAAARHFRDIGLTSVTFYRPRRGLHPPRAIWTSHREVARRALAMGHKRVLILEDDARLRITAAALRKRLDKAFARLPAHWNCLYLGHFPIQAYPCAPGLLRVRSGSAIAYVANAPLLDWLAAQEPMDPRVPVSGAVGASVDAAMANLRGMYALWPMPANVLDVGDTRADCVGPLPPGLERLTHRRFYRDFVTFNGFRVAEALALLASPWNALTLEYFRRRSGQARVALARDVLARGFDERAYLLANPDVGTSGQHPLGHYIHVGVREGRDPLPPLRDFDPEAYRRGYADVREAGVDPTWHYLNHGRAEGRSPCPEPDGEGRT